MKRFVFTFGFLMILVSSGILFFQWMGFTTESAGESSVVEVSQSYSIIHKEDEFQVTQTIHFPSTIPSDPLLFKWPAGAENFTCKDKEENKCLTKENGEFYVSTLNQDPQEITITYSLKQSTKAESVPLRNWYPVLSGISTLKTDIQLTEKSSRNGKWIAGYPSSNHKKLDYIDYYFFSGRGEPSDLVWTKESWKESGSATVKVLTEEGGPAGFDGLDSLESADGFVTILITDNIKPFKSPHLIVINDAYGEQLKSIRQSLLYQTLSSSDEDAWLKELAVSILLNETPYSPKPAWAYKQLKDGLSTSQWDDLRQKIKNQSVDRVMFDEAVSRVTGFKCSYFAEGVKGNEHPLLILKANKPMKVNRKSIQIPYISYQQKEYIQFPEAVEALGIEMKELQPGVYFTSVKGNTLRFYIDEDYFIYNEENYGLLGKPVQMIGDTIFMDIHWYEKLFDVEVKNEENAIKILKEM
ncbi:hypothetical protein [Rossellomorea vietnamensis]|uniref:Copper amine oxidase-like N-terminal domain-containing protein n=1 Tax=Rossellomorea vietnamensis TaxID=218284 RepID=A0A0N8GHG6_9BACI|nr:hypothetical protein [Rossellomorea vietnamensis]KPL61242.1 hypothetical protein AM506_00990 [Rossellomorea vietnamensis]